VAMLILSLFVTFNVTCFTVTFLITKIIPATLANNSCSFYKVGALADLKYGGRFYGTFVVVNFCLQQ